MSAKEVLSSILNELELKAYNPFCVWNKSLDVLENASLRKKFSVVCFTETPIDQIEVLLKPLAGRTIKLEPYGLVFTKKYIRDMGGNPVFYVTKEIAKPLGNLFDSQKKLADTEVCKMLALTTVCDEGNDWHWEREWRVVGNLDFRPLDNIYCGLCSEAEVVDFEYKYEPVVFIDPHWSINRILDKLVKKVEPPF